MSVSSSLSATSFLDIPNLPGLRKTITNPKLYRDFQASKSLSSLHEDEQFGSDEASVTGSMLEASQRLAEFSKSLAAFPNQGRAYNDISGRYSLRSQQADRLTYFTELTPENLLETERSRKVEIVYYTEDSTISINEPTLENSGLAQGKILKRHKVMKSARKGKLPPMSETGEIVPEIPYFTLSDFYAGAELTIYNRPYIILDCDPKTRDYFDEIGSPFGSPLQIPESYYVPRRAGVSRSSNASTAASTSSHASRASTSKLKAQGFFQYDKKCLRYFAMWDAREELFGDKVMVRIHYSMADQLFEVVPVHDRNSGRDRIPKVLKKTKIMKQIYENEETGTWGDFADGSISLSSSLTGGSTTPTTRTASGPRPEQVTSRPYHWKDLFIGARLEIAAMSLVIVDADEFTREFYASKNRPLGPALAVIPEVHPKITTVMAAAQAKEEVDIWALPPKDTFLPIQPPKDGAKLKMLQGVVLRYLANLKNPKPADVTRKFIIQVHLEDDTIQIREPPQRNSGHVGGIFLARGKIENLDKGRYMFPQDIYIGGELSILSHRFNVLDADEYTMKYMENTCKLWYYSDIVQVSAKVKASEEPLKRVLLTTQNLEGQIVKYDEVERIFALAGLPVVKQEVITVCRELDPKKTGYVKLTQLLRFVMNVSAAP